MSSNKCNTSMARRVAITCCLFVLPCTSFTFNPNHHISLRQSCLNFQPPQSSPQSSESSQLAQKSSKSTKSKYSTQLEFKKPLNDDGIGNSIRHKISNGSGKRILGNDMASESWDESVESLLVTSSSSGIS